jgi:hypothetical protein
MVGAPCVEKYQYIFVLSIEKRYEWPLIAIAVWQGPDDFARGPPGPGGEFFGALGKATLLILEHQFVTVMAI